MSREYSGLCSYLFRQYQLEEVSVQNFHTTAVPAALVVVATAFRAPLCLAITAVTLETHTLLARCSVIATAGQGVEESSAFIVVNVELKSPKEAPALVFFVQI